MTPTPELERLLLAQRREIDGLEEDTVRELAPALQAAEGDLQSRLSRLAEKSVTYRLSRFILNRIQNTLLYIEKTMKSSLSERADKANELAFNLSKEEVKSFEKYHFLGGPSVKKAAVSVKQNDFLLNSMRASIESYNAETRQTISDALTQSILQNKSGYETVVKIGRFVNLRNWKIKRIARTEMSKIFNQSKLLNYQEIQKNNFPDLMKRLFHPMDNRTAEDSKQLAKLDPAIPLEEPFQFTYKRKLTSGRTRTEKRVFMTPPDRPNDRAVLVSYRKKWKKKQEK